MMEKGILNCASNIARILNRAVTLFKEIGNTELAEKWDKILKDWYSKNQ